jgi:hypothetical protein
MKRNGDVWEPAPPTPGQPNATDWAAGTVYWIPSWAIASDGALYFARMWFAYPEPTGQIRRIQYTGLLAAPPPSPARPGVALTAHPVPANGRVRLSFKLDRPETVRLAIHDITGRMVRELVPHARRAPGPMDVAWDGRDDAGVRVSAGLYMAVLDVNGTAYGRRVVMVR